MIFTISKTFEQGPDHSDRDTIGILVGLHAGPTVPVEIMHANGSYSSQAHLIESVLIYGLLIAKPF